MRVYDDAGDPVDATFSVEGARPWSVIIESRGGTRGAPNVRNTEYNRGVEIILGRLAYCGALLHDALVDSRVTASLSEDERRLDIGSQYPLPLSGVDVPDLRRLLGAAQRPIGRSPGARGAGNNTKRMRLVIDVPGAALPREGLEHMLSGEAGETAAVREAVEQMTRPTGGQGFQVDPVLRLEIEAHAMRLATEHYRRRGWDVTDVSARESYDLRCTKGTDELRVEVKGTTTSGHKILLTPNEVTHARTAFPQIALVVVSNISLQGGEVPVAAGGKIDIHEPWVIDSGELEPVGWSWTAP